MRSYFWTSSKIIEAIKLNFEEARADIELAGGTIIDSTPGGLINQEGILEYVELGDVLETERNRDKKAEPSIAVSYP